MSTSAKPLEELVRQLSPQLKVEVQTFVESLLSKSNQPIRRKLRQDWAGMLKTITPQLSYSILQLNGEMASVSSGY